MKINFDDGFKVEMLTGLDVAYINMPEEYHHALNEVLNNQDWVIDTHHDLDTHKTRVLYSTGYQYPEGEPAMALEQICLHVLAMNKGANNV